MSQGRDERINLVHKELDEVALRLVSPTCNVASIVDVSNNNLIDVSFLQYFRVVRSVILDHNNLTENIEFPHMPNVNLLWLNYNRINHLFPFILKLKRSMPNLKHLSMMGNPIVPSCCEDTYYEYVQYRLYVLSWLDKLEYLDDSRVTKYEREEAKRFFKQKHRSRHSIISSVLQNAYGRVRNILTPPHVQGERVSSDIV
ncbi:leucine-rich melanocyte differentiation-associated protein-like [Cimex lectularius]|uniref:Leucine-rich melanocyte differentiation-associated protein-like n=1 Tax=Cimex lectularius TaxID=79782 RepID=A0A8I6RG60_CIMLE|nr:leucine-rich melanocyte differentiation-associated protein-like [Cimex lectularius]